MDACICKKKLKFNEGMLYNNNKKCHSTIKLILHLSGESFAKLSSGIGSSGFLSPAPEGRDRIWEIREVGGQLLTSASVTINHTHYSTVLWNRIK